MANINVTYEAMESEAKKLRSKMEDIKGLLDQMERDISDLVSNGFVTDKASVRFHESYEDYHKGAKETIGADQFFEVFVDTPLAVAEKRDPKGLYKKARSGALKNFTGIDSPYETPVSPDIRIDTTSSSTLDAADQIIRHLLERGIIH